jgi:hypothetical protein
VKEITLTRGKVALVEDADWEWLSEWKWYADKGHNTFYSRRLLYESGKCGKIHMHRQILDIDDKSIYVAHVDGNGLNNQRYNLRIATGAQNQRNRRVKCQ